MPLVGGHCHVTDFDQKWLKTNVPLVGGLCHVTDFDQVWSKKCAPVTDFDQVWPKNVPLVGGLYHAKAIFRQKPEFQGVYDFYNRRKPYHSCSRCFPFLKPAQEET